MRSAEVVVSVAGEARDRPREAVAGEAVVLVAVRGVAARGQST